MNAYQIDRDEEEYREYLDEVLGEIQVGNLTFDASRIIEELDPVAFRCGYSEFVSEYPGKWYCDECGDEFDDEDEAEECCNEDEEEEDEDDETKID